MAYDKQTWVDNSPDHPLSAERLNHIEDGIEAVDQAVTNAEVGTELGYAQITGSYPKSGATSNVKENVTGLVVDVEVGDRPIYVTVETSLQNGINGTSVAIVGIDVDGVEAAYWNHSMTVQFLINNFSRTKRLVLTPGSHTIQVTTRTGASNQSISMLPGGSDSHIRVVQA